MSSAEQDEKADEDEKADGDQPGAEARIDTGVASIARVYDAMLGGKDNFDVDRVIRDQIRELAPESIVAAQDGRDFLMRVTRYLAREIGVDQFLDCGSGLPTAENTHQIAQNVNPDARVVYVDNDPVVLAHGRALLGENDRTHFVPGDLAEPRKLLGEPAVTANIDFGRPLALYQVGTLHHVSDEQRPGEIMAEYVDALPSGSYVVLSHFHNPRDGSAVGEFADRAEQILLNSSMGSGWFRTRAEVLAFLGGLEVLEPGLGPVADWWPAGPRDEPLRPAQQVYIGAVARKR